MLMSLENKVGKIREIIITKFTINHERFSRAIEKNISNIRPRTIFRNVYPKIISKIFTHGASRNTRI